jgi:hypothetical protein
VNLTPAGDNWYPKVTEPQPTGVKLLRSGDFGKARNRLGTPRNSNIYSRLRRMALQPRAANAADLKHNLIPNTHGTTVAAYYSNIYVAQFSPGTSHGTPGPFPIVFAETSIDASLYYMWSRYGKLDRCHLCPETRFIYRLLDEHL